METVIKDKGGRPGLYTAAQWDWVKDRRREGYPVKDIAEFLGISLAVTYDHLRGVQVEKRLYPRLDSRKAEFNKLGVK